MLNHAADVPGNIFHEPAVDMVYGYCFLTRNDEHADGDVHKFDRDCNKGLYFIRNYGNSKVVFRITAVEYDG